jgi:hypothetical protein
MQSVQVKFLDKNRESWIDLCLKIGMYGGRASQAAANLIGEAEELDLQIFIGLYANVPEGDVFEMGLSHST